MATFNVSVDDKSYNLSIEEIFALRAEPLCIHWINTKGEEHTYSYEEFSKLAIVRQDFLQLALSIKTDDELSISSADTVVNHKANNNNSSDNKITMDPTAFLKFACSLIQPFSEDPELLESFIDNVTLVKSMATTAPLQAIFIQFVKGRLNGRARTVTTGCETIDDIVSELRSSIVRDSSDVLESRLAALNFDHINLTDFSATVEKIANQLINSLMSEGVSKAKANSMAIRQVIDTCRRSARSDMIKAILASCTFNSPKEVLAKFRTEIAALKKDKLTHPNQRPYNNNNRHSYNNYSRNFQRNNNTPNHNYPNNTSIQQPNRQQPNRQQQYNNNRGQPHVRTMHANTQSHSSSQSENE